MWGGGTICPLLSVHIGLTDLLKPGWVCNCPPISNVPLMYEILNNHFSSKNLSTLEYLIIAHYGINQKLLYCSNSSKLIIIQVIEQKKDASLVCVDIFYSFCLNMHLTPNTPLIQLWCARSKWNMDMKIIFSS